MTRTSVRKFSETPITAEQINILLNAGMAAPSALNRQPWAFIVVDNAEILHRLGKGLHFAKALYTAPLAIVVCGNLKMKLPLYKEFWVQDCSAATQNILLAAKALGLGSLWIGVHPVENNEKKVSEILQLPKHIAPLNIIALGYSEDEQNPKDKYDPKKVKHNLWS
ncbi:MAG: nitroreductase family protein [Christensenellaceae bacterium]|nr:nitroreductase family protein [Christensenellaceae bacterium]